MLIDINRLLATSQKELVEFLLDRLDSLTFDKFPKTLGEALNHDMHGLPFSAQVLISSLIKDVDECNMVGGGINVNGFLIRLVMNALETGMTEWLRKKGVKINGSSCLDELFHNNGSGAFLDLDAHVRKNLMKMFVKLKKEYPQYAAKLSQLAIVVGKAMLSWPVNLKNPAPKFLHCKIAANNAMLGPDSHEDAFDKCPPGKKSNDEEDGEVGPYTVDYDECGDCGATCKRCSKGRARRKIIAKVRGVEKNGGCAAIDKNGVAWGDTPDDQFKLVDYLTGDDYVTIFDHEAKCAWFVFWNYKGIYILMLDYSGDDHVRLLVVFCPWCNMFLSKTGVSLDARQINSRLYTAMSAQWASMFFEILRTPGASFVPVRSLDRPVAGNILFAIAAVQIPLCLLGHLCLKGGALLAKNLIAPGDDNHFSEDCTRLYRSAGSTREDQCLVGEDARHDINRRERRKTSVTHDVNKNYSLLCRGLKGGSEEKMMDLIISGLNEDRKQGSRDVQDRKAVLHTFNSDAKKNNLFVDPGFTGRLMDRFEERRNNTGNTTAQKTNSVAETRRNNGTIEDLMKNGGYAWVQGSVEEGYNAAGEGYTPPTIGEAMGYLRVKGGEAMHVTYCETPPAIRIKDMVYDTVKGRFTSRTARGNTGAQKAVRSQDYVVKTAEIQDRVKKGSGFTTDWVCMINRRKRKGTKEYLKVPKKNAVLIWIEPRPDEEEGPKKKKQKKK